MRQHSTFRIALKAIRRNPMRAMLTTIGVVIGVAAVITMMEVGTGASSEIQTKITSMGANTLIVIPGTASSGGITYGAGSAMTLSPEDAEAINRACPSVRNAAPVVKARVQVVYENRNWIPESIDGTTPVYLDIQEWDVVDGQPFTESNVTHADRVCLIGQTSATELFGEASPVGRQVRLGNVLLRVIGVLAEKGANLMGEDQDDVLLAPWTTVKYYISGGRLQSASQNPSDEESDLYPGGTALYPESSATQAENTPMLVRFDNIDIIMAAAIHSDAIADATTEITEVLRSQHDLSADAPDDFDIINLTEITGTLSATTTLMTRLLLYIAAISLVVGGVGIMNIMLVSVTERTREIGLRMAVGARSRDILRQFLVESVVLCLAGGAIGILIGNGASYFIWRILQWPVAAAPVAAVVAVIISAVVGITFGFFPAWKASRLDPIAALRYE